MLSDALMATRGLSRSPPALVLCSLGWTQVEKVLRCLHGEFQSQKGKAVFYESEEKRGKQRRHWEHFKR